MTQPQQYAERADRCDRPPAAVHTDTRVYEVRPLDQGTVVAGEKSAGSSLPRTHACARASCRCTGALPKTLLEHLQLDLQQPHGRALMHSPHPLQPSKFWHFSVHGLGLLAHHFGHGGGALVHLPHPLHPSKFWHFSVHGLGLLAHHFGQAPGGGALVHSPHPLHPSKFWHFSVHGLGLLAHHFGHAPGGGALVHLPHPLHPSKCWHFSVHGLGLLAHHLGHVPGSTHWRTGPCAPPPVLSTGAILDIHSAYCGNHAWAGPREDWGVASWRVFESRFARLARTPATRV